MATEAIRRNDPAWWVGERANYRQWICVAILTATLAYVLIVYPLAYYGKFVAADATGSPLVQDQDGSFLNRAFFPLAAGLSLLMFLLERERVVRASLAVLVPFALFWGYLGLTTLWALAPSVTLTKFIVLSLLLTAVVPAVAVVDAAERYLKPMFWVAAATIVLNLAFVLLTPATPIGHAGIYSHKNSLGGAAAFCLMFVFFGLGQPQRLYRIVALILLPVGVYILFRSQAKTALGLSVLVPLLAAFFTFARYYLRLSMPVLLGLLAIVVPFVLAAGLIPFNLTDISLAITGDPTFTGRTELWNFAMQNIAQRPWLGYGLQSFWQIGDFSPAWNGVRGFLQRTPHAHEGYLDLLLQGGIVALGLFGVLFVIVSDWISRIADEAPAAGLFATATLLMAALVNLLETTWLNTLDPSTIMFFVFLSAAMFRQPLRRPSRRIHGVRSA